ncbi:MAG: exosortase C-terminal domain/associated protein EpsI [bacterium]
MNNQKKFNRHFFISIVLLSLSWVYVTFNASNEDISLKKDFKDFPKQIGEWQVKSDIEFSKDILEILRADAYLYRAYQNNNSDEALIYVGYYQDQHQGKTIHSPKHCYPGSGWLPLVESQIALTITTEKPITVYANRLIIQKDLDKQLVYYWYQTHDRFITSEYWLKIYTVLDSLINHRSDGAFIRISIAVNGDEEGAEDLLKGFIQDMAPKLQVFLPYYDNTPS